MHSHEIFHRPPKLCISLRASAGFSPAFRRKSPRPRIRGGPLAFRSRQKGVNYCGAAILAAAVKERPTARGHASGPISRRQQPLGSRQPSDFPSSIRSVGPQMSDHPFKNGRVNLRRTTPKNRETRPVIALSPSRDRKMVSPSASGAASFHSRSFSPGGLRGAGINVMDSLSLLDPKLRAEAAVEVIVEAGVFGRERERTLQGKFHFAARGEQIAPTIQAETPFHGGRRSAGPLDQTRAQQKSLAMSPRPSITRDVDKGTPWVACSRLSAGGHRFVDASFYSSLPKWGFGNATLRGNSVSRLGAGVILSLAPKRRAEAAVAPPRGEGRAK